MVLLIAALLVGVLLAVQASANQQLSKAVGTPYGASTLQLVLAATLLVALAAGTGTSGALRSAGGVEPGWLLLAGMASPLYITAGILLLPRLGALAAMGLFVTGQVLASLVLDLSGLLAVPRQPLTPGILLGGVALVVGIAVIVSASAAISQVRLPASAAPGLPAVGGHVSTPGAAGRPATAVRPTAAHPGWIALGLLAGAALPVQGALNAQLRRQIPAPLAVATISFTVATLTIAALLLALLALRRTPTPRLRPLRGMPWWGWLGGLCAAAYVTATFVLIPVVGAAVTVALTVTGQQIASALIDHFGWFRMARRALTSARAAGLALLVTGSVLVQLA
ncbi:DMT family transporter [Geodermatophilus sp. URMC 61]|uniref:DMT family transporter n=1 Tax=Geodermatophilus sp. URMC 61 TaxID=3423411 RepID=UPI00406CCA75